MRRRRRYKKYIISFIICYLLFVPVISYSASKLFHKDTFLISPLAKAIQIVKSATTNPIGDIANETLLSHDESYGIVIKHLQTGMSYSHDETTSFESASLYKLWVMATVYEKLEKKQLVSSSASEAMLLLLKQQTLNDRIPKYLPESINVAHKTGELGGYKHDAGIVFTPKGDYIIVVLSKGDDPSVATERIATFSEKL